MKPMNDAQIAHYARTLMNSEESGERVIGETLWDAIYAASDRLLAAERALSGLKQKGYSVKKILSTIRGEGKTLPFDKYGWYYHSDGWWYTIWYNRSAYGDKWQIWKGGHSGNLRTHVSSHWTKKEALDALKKIVEENA